MSACPPFRIFLGEQYGELMPLILSEMKRNGASISESDSSGEFRVSTPVGAISARYRLDGNSVEVTVTAKPFAVSCGQIQDKMTDRVLDAKAMLRSKG